MVMVVMVAMLVAVIVSGHRGSIKQNLCGCAIISGKSFGI
jgi:hypothetical protein